MLISRRKFLAAMTAAAMSLRGLEGGETESRKKTVILDGDWGGDELQLITPLLASPEIEIAGVTSVFGNTTGPQTFLNGRNILHLLKASQIPVYPGANRPSEAAPQEGDGAHGDDGIGGVKLAASPAPKQTMAAEDFILEQLKKSPEGTVILTASGPLTNIAEAFRKDPETMRLVKQIVIMGGCTEDLPAADMEARRGNITPQAEFNFFMASQDARTVMESGLPLVLLPMNCTQDLSLTPERAKAIRDAFKGDLKFANDLIKMMSAPAEFDRIKFDASPFMHDIHCALYLLQPELYETNKGKIRVETAGENKGRTDFISDSNATITIATRLKEPDKAFELFLQSIVKIHPLQKAASRVH